MIMYAKKKEIENMWTNLTKKDLVNCNGGGLTGRTTFVSWVIDMFSKFK